MRQRLEPFLHMLLIWLTELFLVYPVFLILMVINKTGSLLSFFIPLTAIMAAVSPVLLFNKPKVRIGIFLLLLFASGACLYMTLGLGLELILPVLVCFAILLRWVSLFSDSGGGHLTAVAAMGFAFYCLSALILRRLPEFDAYLGVLGIYGTLAALLAFITFNLDNVRQEKNSSPGQKGLTGQSRQANRWMTALFCLLLLFLTALGFANILLEKISQLGKVLGRLVAAFLTWLYNLVHTGGEQNPQGDPSPMLPMEPAAEPSPFMVLLEKIVTVIVIAALILLTAAGLYFLGKKLYTLFGQKFLALLRRLSTYLGRIFGTSPGSEEAKKGYEDELTSLLEKNESPLAAARRWLTAGFREEKPYALLKDNRERVRFLYRKMLRRALKQGKSLNKSMTPGQVFETLNAPASGKSVKKEVPAASQAREAYELARYGKGQPEDKSLQDFNRYLH